MSVKSLLKNNLSYEKCLLHTYFQCCMCKYEKHHMYGWLEGDSFYMSTGVSVTVNMEVIYTIGDMS